MGESFCNENPSLIGPLLDAPLQRFKQLSIAVHGKIRRRPNGQCVVVLRVLATLTDAGEVEGCVRVSEAERKSMILNNKLYKAKSGRGYRSE